MAAITVTYSGSTILTTDAGGIKTLKTAEKYCLDNIAVQFVPPPDRINELVNRTISSYTNNNVTSIGTYAFGHYTSLTTISFPKCTTIGYSAFTNCTELITISFPECTTIYSRAFRSCTSLTTVSFPKCTSIHSAAFEDCQNLTAVSFPKCTMISAYAFENCQSLTTLSFPKCTKISSATFSGCVRLKSLYLTNSAVATLSHSNAFSSTPIGGYSTTAGTFGSIYVPASLLASYKAATNWTYFSTRFVGV